MGAGWHLESGLYRIAAGEVAVCVQSISAAPACAAPEPQRINSVLGLLRHNC